MPIKPENRVKYPADWKAIRASILARADDSCELCHLSNGASIYRDTHGCPRSISDVWDEHWPNGMPEWTKRTIKVVLTIAHINQDPTDNRPVNLLALCQRCHNRIDLPYRQLNAAATRAARKPE